MAKRVKRLKFKTRYVGYVVATIDGCISLAKAARPMWASKEDWAFLQKELARADAVIAGRNTYNAARARLQKRTTFVFSRHIGKPQKRDGVTFVNPVRANLDKLFAPYRRIAVLGGASVYRHMLERDRLDEFFVTIEPLVFGRGLPMFSGGTKTTRFRLLSVRKLNHNGTLLIHFRRP